MHLRGWMDGDHDGVHDTGLFTDMRQWRDVHGSKHLQLRFRELVGRDMRHPGLLHDLCQWRDLQRTQHVHLCERMDGHDDGMHDAGLLTSLCEWRHLHGTQHLQLHCCQLEWSSLRHARVRRWLRWRQRGLLGARRLHMQYGMERGYVHHARLLACLLERRDVHGTQHMHLY